MVQTGKLAAMAFVALSAAGLVGSTGCQTQMAGMTLPSPHYLEHPPQYVPPSPPFPLSRELAQQEEIASRPIPGAIPGR
jgi:hypothetical protein